MDQALKARIQMQKEAKAAGREHNFNGAFIIATGGGKGKLMIDMAREIVEKYKIKKILYVCDNRRLRDSHEDGFPEQLEKWGTPELKEMIRLECYQTTAKWENEEYDLILADEADFAMTPRYSNIFFKNKFRFKILVTGTLTLAKKQLLTQVVPIIFRCSMQDAENRGIVNKTRYYIYNYRMNDSESALYVKYTDKIALCAAIDDKRTMDYWIGQRRELMYTLDSSYLHTRKLMLWMWKKLTDTRLVIFSQRTTQADRLCKWSYHGKNEKDDNLSLFQKGLISAISVVAKIKRGINLRKANRAIFESLDGSTTEFEQRDGRMKRLSIDELAEVWFMNAWYKTTNSMGEPIYKESITATWIKKATGNRNSSDFIDFKL